MNEKLIERKLRERVARAGGICLKINSQFFTGLPDRLVLLPGGRVFFVELKSTGRKQSERQIVVSEQLRKLGFPVTVIDDENGLESLFQRL